jgi:hypothetical protein
MDEFERRKEKGRELAKRVKLVNSMYAVPSSSGKFYLFRSHEDRCICPDRSFRNISCKHEYAVMYFRQQQSDKRSSEYKEVLDFIKSNGGKILVVQLQKKFGDLVYSKIDKMKHDFEVIEKQGRVMLI